MPLPWLQSALKYDIVHDRQDWVELKFYLDMYSISFGKQFFEGAWLVLNIACKGNYYLIG